MGLSLQMNHSSHASMTFLLFFFDDLILVHAVVSKTLDKKRNLKEHEWVSVVLDVENRN